MKEKEEEDEREMLNQTICMWGTQMISNSIWTSWRV